jgi:hypothetical protein
MELWWVETAAGLLQSSGAQQVVLLLWGSVQLGQRPPAHWWLTWQQCSGRAMAAGSITAKVIFSGNLRCRRPLLLGATGTEAVLCCEGC